MRKVILTISIFLAVINFSYSQETIDKPKLKLIIDSLYNVDQMVQQDFVIAFQRGITRDSMNFYEKREFQTFERHIPIIKKILRENGYPSFKMVGKESSHNYFVLVQHSDVDVKFQKKMLPLIKKQVDKKEVSGSDYAYLYDRVQLNSGKEQLFGTQLGYDNDGNAISKNLKDKVNVNKRRAEYGMSTIEEYLANNTEIHKKMNQKN